MMSPDKQLRYEIAAALAIALLIYGASRLAGSLGVGLLGLLILFIAVQADLDKSATSDVWAMRAAPSHPMDRAENAARHADSNSMNQPILIGKWLGAGLALIGLGLFFFA
ncbi:MAG: hypothetical protein JSR72_05750 [Proteobacteria bacterium]|nr:hypothetical protein [Pseudomonadota bacterium]